MVRMSKAKQEKLESIMHLVEQLGIDRVLGRLRQTKMMSRDVLDDMKDWETDYEKRVALLGFLVSPEGKRAFGALYELSKVHEEQLKLQEEQEKLRQEQLAQQQASELRKFRGGKGGGTASNLMKQKLRAQLAKRREAPQPTTAKSDAQQLPPQPQTQQLVIPPPAPSKTAKRSTGVTSAKKTPAKEVESEIPKDTGNTESQTKTEEQPKPREKPRDRKSPSPIQGITPKPRRTSSETQPPPAENGLELSLTAAAIPIPMPPAKISPVTSPGSQPKSPERPKSPEVVETAPDLSTDGQWGKDEPEAENEVSEEETQPDVTIEEDRPPPDGENAEDDKDDAASSSDPNAKKVRISTSVRVVDVRDSAPNSPSTTTSTPTLKRRKLNEIHQKLLNAEISVDELTMDQIKEIVAEWQIMKKDHGEDGEFILKELQRAKDDLKKMTDEKDKIRKEKDRYVFKEFEVQQKYSDLSQKHKSLRDEHEALKQGNYQIQQTTKKNNKLNQDMRKKITRLESKIKSMDKVTLRKGTQTTEVFDKDVHEALRIAEESLQVTQSELKEALTKTKSAQQEAEDLKKQLNAKGREINKRERKSKKDEETIRFVTRERDAMETKLRKVTEQLEYYKGMIEIRAKGGKRQVPEKKEVRVQRCSSGRHVLLKTHVAAGCHQKEEEGKGKGETEEPKSGSNRPNGRNSLTNGSSLKQAKQTTNKQQSQQSTKTSNDQTSQAKTSTKANNSSGVSNTPNAAKSNNAPTAKQTSSDAKPPQTPTTTQKPPTPKNTNQDAKAQQSKPTIQNKDSADPSKTDKPPAKQAESESTAAKKTVSAPSAGAEKPAQSSATASPSPVKKTTKSDEKPVRPKAATVRQQPNTAATKTK